MAGGGGAVPAGIPDLGLAGGHTPPRALDGGRPEAPCSRVRSPPTAGLLPLPLPLSPPPATPLPSLERKEGAAKRPVLILAIAAGGGGAAGDGPAPLQEGLRGVGGGEYCSDKGCVGGT